MTEAKKTLYLTFDDGPTIPDTLTILDTLRRHQAKATFFVNGQAAKRHPEIVRKIYQDGHAIGNHSYSHRFGNIFSSKKLYVDFKHAEKVLAETCQTSTKLIRAPWGKMMPGLRKQLVAEGYSVWGWDVMAYDWWNLPIAYIAGKIISGAKPGAVILLHDGDRGQAIANRKKTAEAIDAIIPALHRKGYVFVALRQPAS